MARKIWIGILAGALLIIGLALWLRPAPVEASRDIFILMYHDIREEPVEDNDMILSRAAFRAQMTALREAGFETVSFDDLIAYVDRGVALPPQAIVITFDDGYRSNLIYAAPILEELGMCATISVIGVSRGRDTHEATGHPIIPHFSFEEALPWVEAGVIQIQHHSYNMHQSPKVEPPETFREGALRREGESEAEHRAAFIEDFNILRDQIEAALGTQVTVYAYPHGRYTPELDAILRELGVRVTLTLQVGVNTIRHGEPESLFLLNRIHMTEDMDPHAFVAFLESFRAED